MRYFLALLSIILIFLLASFFLLFTQSGNNTIKPYLEKYIAKELQRDTKIEAFTLKTNFLDLEILVDNSSKVIVNGEFDLLKRGFNLSYIVDGKNIKTPYVIIKQPLHVEGKLIGTLKRYQINGAGKAFRSNIRFFLDMQDKNVKNIKIDAKNVKIEDVLAILKKPIYTKGMFDINIDTKELSKDKYKGQGNILIHYGVINSNILYKNFGIKLLENITYRGNISGKIDGNILLTDSNIVSNIAKVLLKKTSFNIEKNVLKSDYEVLLPDISIFEPNINLPLQGKILLSGDLEKTQNNLKVNLHSNLLSGKLKASLDNETLIANANNISIKNLMYTLKKPMYSDGKINLNLKINDITNKNKNGNISLHVDDGALHVEKFDKEIKKVIPYKLKADATIQENIANIKADILSKIANISLFDTTVKLENNELEGKYSLHLPNLQKIEFLTNQELNGEFNSTGNLRYQNSLYIDGNSGFLDANSTYTFENNVFYLKSEELSTLKLSEMLMYPKIFDSLASLSFNYNISTKKGDLAIDALNGKIIRNELSDVLFLASKFDITQEIYKDTLLTAKIDKQQVNFTLLMNGLESYLKIPSGFVDLKNDVIDSDFEVQIKNKDFKGSINGSIKKPEVSLSSSDYLKNKIDKAIEKNIPKEWQDTAKELLKLF
ncbi:hypothetical protein ACKGJI_04355 [Sulfurospirillum sp. 1307]|jgi:hypothetical protein